MFCDKFLKFGQFLSDILISEQLVREFDLEQLIVFRGGGSHSGDDFLLLVVGFQCRDEAVLGLVCEIVQPVGADIDGHFLVVRNVIVRVGR